MAYAEFEMVDTKGVEQIRKRIDDYWMDRMNDEKDTTAQNIQSTSIYDNDTIGVSLMNNSLYFQEMFRRKVVSYSAVNHGRIQSATPFTAPAFLDTLQISMKADRAVYPVGTKNVSVSLNNNNSKVLFFGEDYMVARKEGNQWLLLNGNNAWTDIGIGVGQGEKYQFTASLYPLFNDNRPGNYRVYKEIGFYDSKEKWFMVAEFRIE